MPSLSLLQLGKRRLFIALWLLAYSPFYHAGMIDKKGMEAWEICALCHNANGISRMAKFPKLAGQKADYLEKQIRAFREGRRLNDGGQMQSIVSEITQEDVAQIAAYFASLPADTDLASLEQLTDKKILQVFSHGKSLFYKGREGLSSCHACHTDKLSNAPWLDGQHKQYLEKQIHDFQSGERDADCPIAKPESGMYALNAARIRESLNDAEVEALSLFLSMQRLLRN